LGEMEPEEPSPRLCQGFYRRLERASRRTRLERLREALGFRGNAGWLTAAACLLVGVGLGQLADNAGTDAGARLAALEENVTSLNRRLILDRLDSEESGKRLRGVLDAAHVAGDDAEIAQALLVRATGDRVLSVRSAAIDALGPSIDTPSVGRQLMDLLQQADSPIVQLALVDLVLRYGNDEQVDEVLALAEQGHLHPDLERHVLTTLKRDTA
ncbi:MAG: hypothetical protein ACREVN_09605, partial [Gammaproteobacteria bacterium]